MGLQGYLAHKKPHTPRTTIWDDVMQLRRFQGGLVFKAHRLLYHSPLGLRVIKKKNKVESGGGVQARIRGLQAYLAHKKLPPPLGSPYGPRQRPALGS